MLPLVDYYEVTPKTSNFLLLPVESCPNLVTCYLQHFADENTKFPKMSSTDIAAQVAIHTRWLSEQGVQFMLKVRLCNRFMSA